MELKDYLQTNGEYMIDLQEDIKRILLEKAKPELVETLINSTKNLEDIAHYVFDEVKKEYVNSSGSKDGGMYKDDTSMFMLISHYIIDEPKWEEKKPEPVPTPTSSKKSKSSKSANSAETAYCDLDDEDDEPVVQKEVKAEKPKTSSKKAKEEPKQSYQQMSLFDENSNDDDLGVIEDWD